MSELSVSDTSYDDQKVNSTVGCAGYGDQKGGKNANPVAAAPTGAGASASVSGASQVPKRKKKRKNKKRKAVRPGRHDNATGGQASSAEMNPAVSDGRGDVAATDKGGRDTPPSKHVKRGVEETAHGAVNKMDGDGEEISTPLNPEAPEFIPGVPWSAKPPPVPPLPPVVWVEILSRLHWEQRLRAREVCTLFRDIVPACFGYPVPVSLKELAFGWKEQGEDKISSRMDQVAQHCRGGIVLNIGNMFRKLFEEEFEPSIYISSNVWPEIVSVIGAFDERLDLTHFDNLTYVCLSACGFGVVANTLQLSALSEGKIRAFKLCHISTALFARFRNDCAEKFTALEYLFFSFEDPSLTWPGLNAKITKPLPDGAFPSLKTVYLRFKPFRGQLLKSGIVDKGVTLIRSFEGCFKLRKVKLCVTSPGLTERKIVQKMNENYWVDQPTQVELLLSSNAYSKEWKKVEESLGVFLTPGELLRNPKTGVKFGTTTQVSPDFDPFDIDNAWSVPGGLTYAVADDLDLSDNDESGDSMFGPFPFGMGRYDDSIGSDSNMDLAMLAIMNPDDDTFWFLANAEDALDFMVDDYDDLF